jgi:hypothetical protein
MAKKTISKFEALKMAEKIGVNFSKDFHSQSFGAELSAIAKLVGYKKPSSASGSTGRIKILASGAIKDTVPK